MKSHDQMVASLAKLFFSWPFSFIQVFWALFYKYSIWAEVHDYERTE